MTSIQAITIDTITTSRDISEADDKDIIKITLGTVSGSACDGMLKVQPRLASMDRELASCGPSTIPPTHRTAKERGAVC